MKDAVQEGQIVIVYDEGQPRRLWRLGKIKEVITGSDGQVWGASICMRSKSGRAVVLRRPIASAIIIFMGAGAFVAMVTTLPARA